MAAAIAALNGAALHAFPGGIDGRSGAPGAGDCTDCHSGGSYNYLQGTITGSTSVDPSSLNNYTLVFAKASGATAARAGFNLSATSGTLGDPNTGTNSVQLFDDELTHASPATAAGDGSFSWNFTWTAPPTAGPQTFYFCINPVNNNDGISGDGIVRCGSVGITVLSPAPAPPVAVADSYNVKTNTARTVAAPGVLANDSDVNGDALTAVLDIGPDHGNLTAFNADGSFTYTPDTDYTGADSFTYHAHAGADDSNIVTVSLTVAANAAPVANANAYSATRNTLKTVAAPGVLANDTDADGDTLTAELVSDAANGTVTLGANGGFSYTPDADFTGEDSFTYRATDGISQSGTAIVTIDVNAPSDGGGGGGGGAPAPLMLALFALAAYVRGLNAAKRRAISL